jgi:hypothetical protein
MTTFTTTALPPPVPLAPALDLAASPSVATPFLDAILGRDERAMLDLLAPDVWFRAMLVRETVEHHDAVAAVAMFRGWFAHAAELRVLRRSTYPVATRDHLSYRVLLRPEWAPDVWHLIEQSGYLRIQDGRVRRIDLVCTGFVPLQPARP